MSALSIPNARGQAFGAALLLLLGCAPAKPAPDGPPARASQAATIAPSNASATAADGPLDPAPEPPPRIPPECLLVSGARSDETSRAVYTMHASGRLAFEMHHFWSPQNPDDEGWERRDLTRSDDGRLQRVLHLTDGLFNDAYILVPEYGAHGELTALRQEDSTEEARLEWDGTFGGRPASTWNGVNDAFVVDGLVPMAPGGGRLAAWLPDIRDLGGRTFTGRVIVRFAGEPSKIDTAITFDAGHPTRLEGEKFTTLTFEYSGDRLVTMVGSGHTMTLHYDGKRWLGLEDDVSKKTIEWKGDQVARVVTKNRVESYDWDACAGDLFEQLGIQHVKRSTLKESVAFSCRTTESKKPRCKNYLGADEATASNLCELRQVGKLSPGPCDLTGATSVCKGKSIRTFFYGAKDPTVAPEGCIGGWALIDD